MRIISLCLNIILPIFIIVLAYLLFANDKELTAYKQEMLNKTIAYQQLQSQYNAYREKVENLRRVVVIANNSASNNIAVGNVITSYTSKVDGDVSVYYKNLTTGESVTIDGDKEYYMASLYKVILTIYILDKVKNGSIQLTDTVGDPPIPLEEALNKIITESNNEYAQALAGKYGWANIESAMKQKLSIDFSFSSDLQTTVTSMGVLFEDIALSLNISDSESDYLLRLLNDQQRLSKLPKYLPKNVRSYNKTGEFDDYSHDAGIFYTPKANYILIFMSKTALPGDTNDQMAHMSQDVYKILNDIPTNTLQ